MIGKTLLKEQEAIYRESEHVHSVRAKGALSNSEWVQAVTQGGDYLLCLMAQG